MTNPLFNTKVFDALPTRTNKGGAGVEAVLLQWTPDNAQEIVAWNFLVNPQRIQYKNTPNYSPIATLAGDAEYMGYNYTSGKTITIPDLMFSTWLYQKSLSPLLGTLEELIEAKASKNEFSPPLLRFRWGVENISPCVLVDVDYTVRSRLPDGSPAQAQVTLVLKKIPAPLTPAQAEAKAKERAAAVAKANEAKGALPLPLTQAQKEEAIKQADTYLIKNIGSWAPDVQAAIKGKKYKLEVDEKTGNVKVLGANAIVLGVAIKFDGKTATAGKGVTTIPVRSGVEIPAIEPPKSKPKAEGMS
jgi:hypothetical protein